MTTSRSSQNQGEGHEALPHYEVRVLQSYGWYARRFRAGLKRLFNWMDRDDVLQEMRLKMLENIREGKHYDQGVGNVPYNLSRSLPKYEVYQLTDILDKIEKEGYFDVAATGDYGYTRREVERLMSRWYENRNDEGRNEDMTIALLDMEVALRKTKEYKPILYKVLILDASGFNQTEIGEACEVSQQTASRYLTEAYDTLFYAINHKGAIKP